jgi:hypothetical protein
MKRYLIAVAAAVAIAGCSTFTKNASSTACDNPQQFLANLPQLGITPAQAAALLNFNCSALFGEQPMPTPAADMTSVFGEPKAAATPPAATPAPSAAASPAA